MTENRESNEYVRTPQPGNAPRIGNTLPPNGDKPSMTTKPSREVTEKKPKSISTLTIDVDVSEGITALKALQREAKETVKSLKEVESIKNKDKLFVIEINSINSVPRVFYKGEEITGKTAITLNWKTKTDCFVGDSHVLIDYMEKDEVGRPVFKKIREFKDKY